MRNVLALIVVSALLVSGCDEVTGPNSGTPTEVPTIVQSPSESTTGAASPTPTRPTTPPIEPNEAPKPSATLTEEGTPAVQFARRWGLIYPDLAEYKILRAANAYCAQPETGEEILTELGLSDKDRLRFTQDADQNYCPSMSNPV